MINLFRRHVLPDGRVELFTPKKNEDGYYILADRAVDAQHNKAVNQFFIRDIEAVVARIRRGGVSLRMQGEITRQSNLISAREIEIEETPVESAPSQSGDNDDPFATFTEWNTEADEAAYRDL